MEEAGQVRYITGEVLELRKNDSAEPGGGAQRRCAGYAVDIVESDISAMTLAPTPGLIDTKPRLIFAGEPMAGNGAQISIVCTL